MPHSRSAELRHTLNKEEALRSLDMVFDLEPDTFQDTNSHLVQEHFRELFRSNDFSFTFISLQIDARTHTGARKQETWSILNL